MVLLQDAAWQDMSLNQAMSATSSSPRAGSYAFRKIAGGVLLGLGLIGLVSLVTKEFRLTLFGEKATGVVRKVEEITTSTQSKWIKKGMSHQRVSRSGPSYFMTIAYTTKDGKQIEFETLATFNTVAKVGDEHPLVYLPEHPENAKISTARQLWLPMIVGIIFTTVCLGLGALLLSNRRIFPEPKPGWK